MKLNNIVLDFSAIDDIEKRIQKSIKKTADEIKTDVQQSQTMPYETGTMQDRSTFVDDSEINNYSAAVVSDTPYSRRLYFHPEYNFSKKRNPNAGGEWFEPYISGDKKNFPSDLFKRFMKGG